MLAALALLASSMLGCSGSVVVDGDGGGGGGECCLAEPVCPPEAEQVDTCSTPDCFTVEACCSEILCEPIATCEAYPVCELYEMEVPSCESSVDCRAVSLCGSTIYCQAEEFCDGYPSCDPGDLEISACPPDALCYSAESCGYTITCMDAAYPEHGCPELTPVEGSACAELGQICDYPLNDPDCFQSYSCDENGAGAAWTVVGGGCAGG